MIFKIVSVSLFLLDTHNRKKYREPGRTFNKERDRFFCLRKDSTSSTGILMYNPARLKSFSVLILLFSLQSVRMKREIAFRLRVEKPKLT